MRRDTLILTVYTVLLSIRKSFINIHTHTQCTPPKKLYTMRLSARLTMHKCTTGCKALIIQVLYLNRQRPFICIHCSGAQLALQPDQALVLWCMEQLWPPSSGSATARMSVHIPYSLECSKNQPHRPSMSSGRTMLACPSSAFVLAVPAQGVMCVKDISQSVSQITSFQAT